FTRKKRCARVRARAHARTLLSNLRGFLHVTARPRLEDRAMSLLPHRGIGRAAVTRAQRGVAAGPSGGALAVRTFAFGPRTRISRRTLVARAPKPEIAALVVLAGVLNLWALSRNGFANEYYSAAVRSMSTSWHDFLFASLDKSGLMTVDK